MNNEDMETELKKTPYLVLVMLIWVVSVMADLVWLQNSSMPPAWDQALHLERSLEYYDILTNSSASWFSLVYVDNYYPPFYHFVTALWYFLVGTSMKAAISINFLFFGVLLILVYGIGRYLFDEETGLFAAVIISLYPMTVMFRREYLLDFALVAMVAASVYTLLLTDCFRKRAYSILFGVVLGLTLLTKWTAIFFIAGPLAFVLYTWWKNLPPGWWGFLGKCLLNIKEIFRIAMIGGIAFGLAAIWYIPNFQKLTVALLWGNGYWTSIEGKPSALSWESLGYYLPALVRFQDWLFLLFIISLVLLLIIKGTRAQKVILFSWVLVPYIALTLYGLKADRYLLSVIPALAIITGSYIYNNKPDFRSVLIIITIIVGLVNLSVLLPLPQKEDWKAEQILSDIAEDAGRQQVTIGVLSDTTYVNGLTYSYYIRLHGYPMQVVHVPYQGSVLQFKQELQEGKYQYLILKFGENSVPARQEFVTEIYDIFRSNGMNYIEIQRYSLPDTSELVLLRRTGVK